MNSNNLVQEGEISPEKIRSCKYMKHLVMEDESESVIPAKHDLSAKWDAFLHLGTRRFVYSSVAGAFAGLLLFRSPVTRWASVAFGAGVGIGSAYSECSQNIVGSPQKSTPNIPEAPLSKDEE
ncbi:hypothetical protein CASFOL_021763 [Castilleja foliolosa]|uniref:MICOS complex subunit MIC10 n=1 Tax=Castilleja foliolosa TaxID=1961234 RepID=A0ABD3CYR9_9LAMI